MGSAVNYGILAGSALTLGGTNVLTGQPTFNAGIAPGVAATASDFTSVGATLDVNNSSSQTAQLDLATARAQLVGLGATQIAGELGGQVFTPGVYASVAAFTVTSNFTLDGGGDGNALFVFHTGAALSTTASMGVTLINGASAENVYWVVDAAFSTGAITNFSGHVIAAAAIDLGASTIIHGQLLGQSQSAVTTGASSQIIYSIPATSTPSATPTVSATPSATPEPTASPTPTVSPTPTSSPIPSPSASSSPTSPTPPQTTVAPTPSATPAPTNTPEPTPSPVATNKPPVPEVTTTYFSSGSATLSTLTRQTLKRLVTKLAKAKILSVKVVGFSDQTPGAKNDPIALKRAKAVAAYLHQISPNLKLKVSSAGQASNPGVAHNGAAQRINRRVEIR